jgi:hypothetical protein
MRNVSNTARLNTARNRFQKTSEPELPVTHKELEDAGQQSLRFRPFDIEEERSAVNWWAMRILHAEASTGNPEASRKPEKYLQVLKLRLVGNEDVLLGVVEEWRKAKGDAMLDQPIWTPAATRSTPVIGGPRALAAAQGT